MLKIFRTAVEIFSVKFSVVEISTEKISMTEILCVVTGYFRNSFGI